MSDWQLYKRLLRYMSPYIGAAVFSIVGFMLYALMNMFAADVLQFVVDAFGEDKKLDAGIVAKGLKALSLDLSDAQLLVPLSITVIAFFRGVGFFIGNYYMALVGRGTIHDLRIALFNHMLKLPTAFYDANTGGHLVSRITYNVEQVTGAITKALTVIIREGLTVLFLLLYLFYISWKLSLIFLTVAPIIALIVAYVSKRFRRISRRIQNSMGDVTHVSSEAVNAHREVRIFGGEEYEQQRFFSASDNNCNQAVKMAATSALFSPTVQFLFSLALAALMGLGLQEEFRAQLTPGLFVAYLMAAGMLAKPLRQLSGVLAQIQRGLAAAEDIFEQLDQSTEPDAGSLDIKRLQGNVRFEAVCFRYRDDLPDVLQNISFEVKAGETVALVGSSGSGKSSLVSLLPRFYRHTKGGIFLDDVNIEDYQLASLRRNIALVSQQVVMFNDTVLKNIAYGSLQNSSEQQVDEAMQIANAKEFIDRMSDGKSTLIGDNGVMLSGGQRQRLAIARAVLKDAPILILDEATSALDNESERLIQEALEKVMKGRTTFVIAHRLSTVENADKIIVLEAGNIVEVGDHASLLARNGRYAKLYNNQFAD